MHNVVVEKPYRFTSELRHPFWPAMIQALDLHSYYLRRKEGLYGFELRGVEHLRESLQQRHGILLTPNHTRYADPMALGYLSKAAGCHLYAMASWHLYNEGWFKTFAIRAMGAFSIHREGVDRQAINRAIEIIETAERPLVIFPEGTVSRTNDHLHALLDGVAFIARTAAKRRAKADPPQKVVVHPVALKYLFQDNLDEAVGPALTEMEQRFSWRPQLHLTTYQRVTKLVRALLALKEVEYFGEPQTGSYHERWEGLINRLLNPIEREWLGELATGPVVPRVKALRTKILPDLVQNLVTPAERARRFEQLHDIYLAQQVSCYPPDYLVTRPSVDRVLETVERLEDDLFQKVRVHGRLKVIIEVGEPIEVAPQRDRKAEVDPLMTLLEERMQRMLDQLALESPLVVTASEPPLRQPETSVAL